MIVGSGNPLDDLLHEERIRVELLGKDDATHFLDVHFQKVSIGLQIQTDGVSGG